jgi:serine/threonine protein kinase
VVKVTDFGLSRDKEWRPDTQAGTAMMTGCGTALWMAPEILSGKHYNESVDVFSYAMCLLELIACEMPWQSVSGPGGASRGMLLVSKVPRNATILPVSSRLAKSCVCSVWCDAKRWLVCGGAQGERPDTQLRRASPAMKQLVRRCWAHEPSTRPSFTQVCTQLEEMVDPQRQQQQSLSVGAGRGAGAAVLGGLAPVIEGGAGEIRGGSE